MAHTSRTRIIDLLKSLDCLPAEDAHGLPVTSACDGQLLLTLPADTQSTLGEKIQRASIAQKSWRALPRNQKASQLEALSHALKENRDTLAELIMLDSGKTLKETLGETDGSADILLKTIKDATLPELNGMLRTKERPPAGIVGLITSFNFPLVVANWTIAPALLAGNAVIWKPSEKTPLIAYAYKALFDRAMGEYGDLLQILIGTRVIGEALIAHEQVDMISATGSVGMGQGIQKTLAAKTNKGIAPILELGGNNAVILSDKMSADHLAWSVNAIINSFFGTAGQRCTNTRRIIVHSKFYLQAETLFKNHIEALLESSVIQNPASGASNEYGYGPLIDADAFARFEKAQKRVIDEGGTVLFGERLLAEQYPDAYYVEPALALLPTQSPVMFEETFAPLLFIVPYEGDIDHAIALVNAPPNAGLVAGLYTQSQPEADRFAVFSEAGHCVINSPKGTGTPAFGMGFGGNKASGEGEILNSADPLRPFTRDTRFSRTAQNKDITMDWQ